MLEKRGLIPLLIVNIIIKVCQQDNKEFIEVLLQELKERWPPYNRHMGVPDSFRFHEVSSGEGRGEFLQLGVNYAHNLVSGRQSGSGNAALGNPPGPAPPRLIICDIQNPYRQDDLYKVNNIFNISPGMSLLNNTRLPHPDSDASRVPLNPRQYLELTLNQYQGYPGTFPHYSTPVSAVRHRCERFCGSRTDQESLSPLTVWLNKEQVQERVNAQTSN